MATLPHERVRQVAALWGTARMALGVAAVAAPRAATWTWVGPAGPGPSPAVLGRALGGRDLGLGAGTLRTALTGHPLAGWALAGGAADVVDGVATLLAREELPTARRNLVLAASFGSALLALALTVLDEAADREAAVR